MSVRITGGVHSGRILREPIPRDVRPTSARVREALFSMLGQDLEGVSFLDAFGGAGLMGIEAWSRGADVTVVERDRRTAKSLERRGREVGATWRVRTGDVRHLVSRLGHFDVVFADPPYDAEPAEILKALAVLDPDWLVYEADFRTDCPDEVGELVLDRRRRYGRTALWLYRRR